MIVNALIGSIEDKEVDFYVYNNYRGSSSIMDVRDESLLSRSSND